MSKQLFVDPVELRKKGSIHFEDIPVNQYNKTTRYTKSGGNFPIRSFKIKRGYMVTMANNIDGTGYSHFHELGADE